MTHTRITVGHLRRRQLAKKIHRVLGAEVSYKVILGWKLVSAGMAKICNLGELLESAMVLSLVHKSP